METGQIEIFQGPEGTQIEVQFEQETVWLTQKQMAELFGRTRVAITQHIGNIFKEGELEEIVVCKDFLHTTAHGALKGKTQQSTTKLYNLDVIISVGYRVKSLMGTQFRIWATKRLKDYLVQGYAINEKRLAQKEMQVQHLKTGIQILSRAIEQKAQQSDNKWLLQYAKGLELLDDYDHERLDAKGISQQAVAYPTRGDYQKLIDQMKADFDTAVFGKEKDSGFESAIHQIAQSFDNDELYPSIEEKAAMLLYLVVKNHAFVDGNKRIAAACFLLFLERNQLLTATNGQMLISNEALASITLFVAASKPEEMQVVKRLIISVLNRNQ